MAAISTNAEYMQHCVVKYWTRLVNAASFLVFSILGERPQPRFLPPFMVCTVAKFNGAYTGHNNKHSECSRQPRTIAKLSAT